MHKPNVIGEALNTADRPDMDVGKKVDTKYPSVSMRATRDTKDVQPATVGTDQIPTRRFDIAMDASPCSGAQLMLGLLLYASWIAGNIDTEL